MFTIYSTEKNKEASYSLAEKLNFKVEIANIDNFNCKEKLLYLNTEQIEEKAIIIHELWPCPEQKIIELLLLLDLLESKGLKSATLVVPYIPYLRQDRELKNNAAIASRMLFRLFDHTAISKIMSIDCHSEKAISYCRKEFINLSPASFFAQILRKKITDFTNTIIISPDEGSSQRAENLANLLKTPYQALSKSRNSDKIEITGFNSDKKYQNIIIIDDILDTGNTIKSTIEALNNNYEKLTICITHLLNENSLNSIKMINDKIAFITTNSTNYLDMNIYENIWQIFNDNFLYMNKKSY